MTSLFLLLALYRPVHAEETQPQTCKEAARQTWEFVGRPWITEVAQTRSRLDKDVPVGAALGLDGLPRLYVGDRAWEYDPVQRALSGPPTERERLSAGPKPEQVQSDAIYWSQDQRNGWLYLASSSNTELAIQERGKPPKTVIGLPAWWSKPAVQLVPIQRFTGGSAEELWILARPFQRPRETWEPSVYALPFEGGWAAVPVLPDNLRRVLDADAIAMDSEGNAWGLDYEAMPNSSFFGASLRIAYPNQEKVRRVELGARPVPEPRWDEIDDVNRQWGPNSDPLLILPLPQGRMLVVLPPLESRLSPSVWLIDSTLQAPCIVKGDASLAWIPERSPADLYTFFSRVSIRHAARLLREELSHLQAKLTREDEIRPEINSLLPVTSSARLLRAVGQDDVVLVEDFKQYQRSDGQEQHQRMEDKEQHVPLALWAPPPPEMAPLDGACIRAPLRQYKLSYNNIDLCIPFVAHLGGRAPYLQGVLQQGARIPLLKDGRFLARFGVLDWKMVLTPIDLGGLPGRSTTVYFVFLPYLVLLPFAVVYGSLWVLGGLSTFLGRNRTGRSAAALRSAGFVEGLDSPAFFFGRIAQVRQVVRALARGQVVIVGGPQRSGKSWLASVVQSSLLRLAGSLRHYRELPIAMHNLLYTWTDPRRPLWQAGAWLGWAPSRPERRCLAVESGWSAHHDMARAWRQLAHDIRDCASDIYKESTIEGGVAHAAAEILEARPGLGERERVLRALAICKAHNVRLVLVLKEAHELLFSDGKRTPMGHILAELLQLPSFTALLEGPRLEESAALRALVTARRTLVWGRLPPLSYLSSLQLLLSLSHLAPRRPSLWCAFRIARRCRRHPYMLQQVGKRVLEGATFPGQQRAYPARVVGWSEVADDVNVTLSELQRELRTLAAWDDNDFVQTSWRRLVSLGGGALW